ncbi:E3 ubiquitin-protein ligase RNF13 [Nilaparvata lugens]|uniref:E3 ubiquitin-protein ligase RNF13 n=1 Tax=Nilaparvata lugens TaxID=108931 RepID=UPI00193D54C6|nr:E3 ubiquitin-protein ligase RNF13 [Nilaparvata lugens]
MSENKNSNAGRNALGVLAGAAAIGVGYALYSIFTSESQEHPIQERTSSSVTNRSTNSQLVRSSPRAPQYDTHSSQLERSEKQERKQEYKLDVCSICLEEVKGIVKVLTCDHHFHMKCVDEWFQDSQRKCPICRIGVEYTGE